MQKFEIEARELIRTLVPDNAEFEAAVSEFDKIDEQLEKASDPEKGWKIANAWARAKLRLYQVERSLLEQILAGYSTVMDEHKKEIKTIDEQKAELKHKLSEGQINRSEWLVQVRELNKPIAEIVTTGVKPTRGKAGRASLLVRTLGARSESLFPLPPSGGLRKFGAPAAKRQSPLEQESLLDIVCKHYADRYRDMLAKGKKTPKEKQAVLERLARREAIAREHNRLLREQQLAGRRGLREQAVKNVEKT